MEATMNGHVRDTGVNGLMFMTGLIAGVGAGFLLAPRSGEETIGRLRYLASDAGVSAGRLIEDMRGAVTMVREHTKRLLN
jgi:gas vesicle protein